eukprot:COSAG05_NODE_2453_length_3046_cov_5.297930_1_plen_289_part_00
MELELMPKVSNSSNPALSKTIDFDSPPRSLPSPGGFSGSLATSTDSWSNFDDKFVQIPAEFAQMFSVGRWLGLGSTTKTWRYLFRSVLVCMIYVQPMIAVYSSHSFLYSDRDSNFGGAFAVIAALASIASLASHIFVSPVMDMNVLHKRGSSNWSTLEVNEKGQVPCTLKQGHMRVLLKDIDIHEPAAKNLRIWLAWGFYFPMGMACLLSSQGFIWLMQGWFSREFGPILDSPDLEGLILWSFFYFVGMPAQVFQICYTLFATGTANAATVAHLGKVQRANRVEALDA